jgi:hypothetical protein
MINSRAISSSQQQSGTAAWPRLVLTIAAWVEILVGASFVLVLQSQSQLLFGTSLDDAGAGFGRVAGFALIALGVACLPSKIAVTRLHAARVLLVYNIGAAILFAWIGLTTSLAGVVLWPVVTLHTVLAIALALSFTKDHGQ